MPDIDPAALSRVDSISQPSTSLVINKQSTAPAVPAPKAQKAANTVQRIDLEPLYTSLKAAIGDQWAKYKEATSLFILGQLNQNELFVRIGHFFSADPSIERLHNQLISAIHGNVSRDVPDHGVALWVSANDKPTVLSKPVVGDAAEQRLKTEVMQMPARDRRRLKEVHDKQGENIDPLTYSVAVSINDYLSSKTIKLPDTVPASAGGLNKTNWDPEIRKHYTQPLFTETLEFPDPDSISLRMKPICFEESLPQAFSPACPEYLSIATEQYIKDVMGTIFFRTRSDLGLNGGNEVRTHSAKLKPAKSDAQAEREKERERWMRRPMNAGDLRFALDRGDLGFGQSRAVVKRVMSGWEEGVLEGWAKAQEWDEELLDGFAALDGAAGAGRTNGSVYHEEVDDGWGWEGGGKTDRTRLSGLLDECLAIGH